MAETTDYPKIATRQLSAKQLDIAIHETSGMIKNGTDPETAWRRWFHNHKPASNKIRLLKNDIPMIAETLLLEPSKQMFIGGCSDATAKSWESRINAYMDDGRHKVCMQKDDDDNYTLVLKDLLFEPIPEIDRTNPLSIFPEDSVQYKRLEHAAEDLSWRTSFKTKKPIVVAETYYDYGQNWKYTTLIQEDPNFGGIQILNPKEQITILYGTKEEYENLMTAITEKLNARQ